MLLVTSLTHVSGAMASVQTSTSVQSFCDILFSAGTDNIFCRASSYHILLIYRLTDRGAFLVVLKDFVGQ